MPHNSLTQNSAIRFALKQEEPGVPDSPMKQKHLTLKSSI